MNYKKRKKHHSLSVTAIPEFKRTQVTDRSTTYARVQLKGIVQKNKRNVQHQK